jgi:hypothetical protein
MKTKPHKVTVFRHLSAIAEHTVLDRHIHQTLKNIEVNLTAHVTARPADARCDPREHSLLQHIPFLRQACCGCPCRLGSSNSFCCE